MDKDYILLGICILGILLQNAMLQSDLKSCEVKSARLEGQLKGSEHETPNHRN